MQKPLKRIGMALALAASCMAARASVGEGTDLTELSLNDLMNIEISSVSKRAEPLTEAAAAITVITAEDLQRSGVRNLAEALRRVPGVQVARADARQYAISVRGFNSTSADKLEVRLDGRSVYSPLFSGVFWDVFEYDLRDVARIEVIRGPGAALYGANAVNGVINVITKSAADAESQGGAVQLAAGNEEKAMLAARQVVQAGGTSLRINALGNLRDDSRLANGEDDIDASRFSQLSLRSDKTKIASGVLMTSLNAYDARFDGPEGDTQARGQSLLARYSLPTTAGESTLQLSYEHTERSIPTLFSERRDTAKFDVEQQRVVGAHQLIYGVGIVSSKDKTGGPPLALPFLPANRRLDTYSAFVQDQVSLAPGLMLTLGSKFEHNDLSGFEAQPSARLGWRADAETFVWGALSRAVRTPNRLDQDVAIFCPEPNGFPGVCPPGLFRLGNPELDSEKLIAVELGLRRAIAPGLSADLALFHNDYDQLRSSEPTVPFNTFANGLEGEADGLELALHWRASANTELQGSYSLLSLRTRAGAESADTSTPRSNNGSSPRHSVALGLNHRIAPQLNANLQGRYVSRLVAQGIKDRAELAASLRYQWRPQLMFALTGENLLHDQEPEFGTDPATRSELQRSVWLTAEWRWQ